MSKPPLTLTESMHRHDDIDLLHRMIERQDDIIHQHTQNLTLINEGLAMALTQLREMKAKGND